MKNLSPSFLFLCSALACSPVPALSSVDFGSIAFVGDSITQGGGPGYTKSDKSLSYRYWLWKCFVDNGESYTPVGSTTIFCSGESATSIPGYSVGYLGKTFDNRNEGHYGWKTFEVVTGRSGGTSGSGKLSEWLTKDTYYPEGYANTMTLMLGVNDLSLGYSVESTASYAKQIVQEYKKANSGVISYVFSILPTTQTWSGKASSVKIGEYNDYIKREIEQGAWGENVSYCDVTFGFDSTVHTSDNIHPNAQGALIVAGNMARALGVGQRTVGKERVAAKALALQTTFSSGAGSGISVGVINKNGELVSNMTTSGTSGKWTVTGDGNIEISSTGGASDIRYVYSSESGTHEFTLDVGFRMNDSPNTTKTNRMGIWCGNGTTVGLLYVDENAIFWDSTVLFRNNDKSDLFVNDFSNLRMAWINGNAAQGIAAGYYVWLDDMLIGEALSGTTTQNVVNAYKNSIVIGNTSSSLDTYAEISNISFDAGRACAPSSIPEPSAFGVLAGMGAIAFSVLRRRRKDCRMR